MKHRTFWPVMILLLAAFIVSFSQPREKHEGTGFIPRLEIPNTLLHWRSPDMRELPDVNLEDDLYNFVSDVFVQEFVNRDDKSILLIILDAGNFHHPKVCFTGAGYQVKELNDTEFQTHDRTFRAHTMYVERETESYISFYWIIIDRKIVHEWIHQKVKQLYFSLFNKERVGLMVRLDIPAAEDDLQDVHMLAQEFITDVMQGIEPEQADFLFGSKPVPE